MTQDYLKFLILKDLVYIKLKELGRYHQKAVKQRIPLKIQLISYIDQVSPVLQYFFKSGVHQNSIHTLLKEIPTPNSIASMYKTHLPTAILVKIQPENCVIAQMSVGVGDSYLSISKNSGHRTDRVIGKQLFHTDFDMANKVTCLTP